MRRLIPTQWCAPYRNPAVLAKQLRNTPRSADPMVQRAREKLYIRLMMEIYSPWP